MDKVVASKLAELQAEVEDLRAEVTMIKHFSAEISRNSAEMTHQLSMLLGVLMERTPTAEAAPKQQTGAATPKEQEKGDESSGDESSSDDDACSCSESEDDEKEASVVVVEVEKQQQEEPKPAVALPEEDDADGFFAKLAGLLRRLFPRAERYDPKDPRILMALSEMGFGDEERIRTALVSSRGIVDRAVDTLLHEAPPVKQ